MRKKWIAYILLSVVAWCSSVADAQILDMGAKRISADSLRIAIDKEPYFSLYKDNYFCGGTSVGDDKPSYKNSDIKFQISISQRLTKSTLPFDTYLFIFYNQKVFWNVFDNSMPVHDFNFNPGVGLSRYIIKDGHVVGKASLLVEHESNGRDEENSRSWNKVSLCGSVYVSPCVMVHGKYWIPIIDGMHNKDILKYSGIFQAGVQVLSSDKRCGLALTLVKREGWNMNFNTIVELNFKVMKKNNQYIFLQYYNGYGESLLDYNKFHSRLRVGFVIKPKWFSEY